ncbi:Hypothetical protein A7982_09418 [Minicystis rosea]|nr:Hypothetical protein A7982_09418 [Minicystis rosea]
MPELHDVVVESPVGFQRYAEATYAELEELRGTITLLRDVHVIQRLVLDDEYALISKASGRTIYARYLGPDHAKPGALVFGAIPRRGRASRF